MAWPYLFGSPTPVIITDGKGDSGTSANVNTVDASDGAGNATAPVFANQIGWMDGGGKLQIVSATNPLPTSGGGVVSLTTPFVAVQVSATGTLVALTPAKSIRVVSLALISSGTVNVKFQSHVSPTDITGLFYLIANTGFVLPYNPSGWFGTIAGEALDINLSAGVAVGGCMSYVVI